MVSALDSMNRAKGMGLITMRVLMVHNRYQQRGGEDAVVSSEANLLAANGIDVETLIEDNDSITGLKGKIDASVSVFYGVRSQKRVSALLTRFKPDVVHVHNWFPTVSPAIFWTCKRAGIPVVNTLHNYRLLCVNATLFRNGGVCEDCIGSRLRAPGVIHKCYRGSRAGSAVATAGMLAHWTAGTWQHAVDRFIALSAFAKNKLVQGGLPEAKIVVKPNFVDPDPGPKAGGLGYYLFVGRLTEEKGIRTLIECWRRGPDLPILRILGGGPLEDEVREAAASMTNVEWLGSKSADEVSDMMGSAEAILCPSLWYEGMPRVVIEAMAVGTPVIASRLGSYPEMIEDGVSGVLFESNDADALRRRILDLEERRALAGMRQAARRKFESEYTGPRNLNLLLDIYRGVLPWGDRITTPASTTRTNQDQSESARR